MAALRHWGETGQSRPGPTGSARQKPTFPFRLKTALTMYLSLSTTPPTPHPPHTPELKAFQIHFVEACADYMIRLMWLALTWLVMWPVLQSPMPFSTEDNNKRCYTNIKELPHQPYKLLNVYYITIQPHVSLPCLCYDENTHSLWSQQHTRVANNDYSQYQCIFWFVLSMKWQRRLSVITSRRAGGHLYIDRLVIRWILYWYQRICRHPEVSNTHTHRARQALKEVRVKGCEKSKIISNIQDNTRLKLRKM